MRKVFLPYILDRFHRSSGSTSPRLLAGRLSSNQKFFRIPCKTRTNPLLNSRINMKVQGPGRILRFPDQFFCLKTIVLSFGQGKQPDTFLCRLLVQVQQTNGYFLEFSAIGRLLLQGCEFGTGQDH